MRVSRPWSVSARASRALDESLVALVGRQQLLGQHPAALLRERGGQADLDQDPLRRERRPQLVRGIGREPALCFVAVVETVEHRVDRAGEAACAPDRGSTRWE